MSRELTRVEGFIAKAELNIAAIDALEAIQAQLEVANVALFALGREYDVDHEIGFRAVMTVYGDLYETLDSLKRAKRNRSDDARRRQGRLRVVRPTPKVEQKES